MIGKRSSIAEGVAAAMGATAEVDIRMIFVPTVNDIQESEFAARVCGEMVGAENVARDPPVAMGSEDFSFMLHEVPAVTSTSATVARMASVYARCTTRPTTSTTPPSPSAPASSPTWSSGGWRGTGRRTRAGGRQPFSIYPDRRLAARASSGCRCAAVGAIRHSV